jgi:UDP-4-amino-4,6-dideoxy-N-acetyl-beta-L-altrosamine transaminase
MKIISYGRQSISEEDVVAVTEVLKSDFLTQGPKVKEFEDALCKQTGAKYCVAVANGTAALHIAVAALDIERGSEGITTPITFAASANCMLYSAITPRFADIDERTYNIDPKSISSRLNKLTRLIIPVHFAGQPADMLAISEIAKHENLFVIEDAAHAIGSQYADGSYVGNCKYSDMTTFSFHPVKTITTGEGGAITTNSKELYEKLLLLRSHGITKDEKILTSNPGPWYYEMHDLGFNYRMTDMQAALGISQLSRLSEFKKRRREIVSHYNAAFKNVPWVTTPWEKPNVLSCFHLYVLKINFEAIKHDRKDMMEYLFTKNIGTQVHYIPVNTLPFYLDLTIDECPVSENYFEQCLSIPLYPSMSKKDVSYVIDKIKSRVL